MWPWQSCCDLPGSPELQLEPPVAYHKYRSSDLLDPDPMRDTQTSANGRIESIYQESGRRRHSHFGGGLLDQLDDSSIYILPMFLFGFRWYTNLYLYIYIYIFLFQVIDHWQPNLNWLDDQIPHIQFGCRPGSPGHVMEYKDRLLAQWLEADPSKSERIPFMGHKLPDPGDRVVVSFPGGVRVCEISSCHGAWPHV